MDEVLWKDKRIQGIILVYRILVVSLQLIECYNVPNGEDDERGANVNAMAGEKGAAPVPAEKGCAGPSG